MSLELIVVSAVSASGLGWYMRQIARTRQRMRWERENQRSVFQIIERTAVPNPYRVFDSEGALPPIVMPFLACIQPLADQFASLGYEPLPGIVTAFSIDHLIRGFVDPTGTIIGVVAANGKSAVLQLTTFAEGASYNTRRGLAPSVAAPPTLHRQVVDAAVPLADMIARHKSLVPPGIELVTIGSCDELVAQLVKHRRRTIEWRAQQAPDDLLDQDLRGLLGEENYRRFGAWFTRRIRTPLPTATLKRR